MSLEDVEKLTEETAEAVAYQNEIDQMLTSRMTVDKEEVIQRELAQLQAKAIGTAPILEPASTERVELPLVPAKEPTGRWPTETYTINLISYTEPERGESAQESEPRVAIAA
ncbi:Vacuolar protein sorting-associated protein 20 [Ceratobasidium sp. UAMH 11750]|nr:Vacuolar protein sorting-associated protein 20 [Ceratobasidium sp. UAMH 11750]